MESSTTLTIHDQVTRYDGPCAECGEPTAILLIIRDWADNRNGYPTTHLLCKTCAEMWVVKLTQLLKMIAGDWQKEALAFLRVGRKIEAIKLCRRHTGMSLKDSRTAVENLQFRV